MTELSLSGRWGRRSSRTCGSSACGATATASSSGGSRTAGVSRSNRSKTDIRVCDGCVGSRSFDVSGLARSCRTSTTSNSRLGRISSGRVVAIKPKHVCGVIIPDTHDEYHTIGKGFAHVRETTVRSEGIGIAEGRLLLGTEVSSDGVHGVHSRDIDLRVLDDLAILDVETTDLAESTARRVGAGQELSDDGELGAGINREALSIEALVAHSEGVEITTIGVANTVVPRCDSTVFTGATGLSTDSAWMGCVGRGYRVGFPDIHLIAAGAIISGPCVGVVGRRRPSGNVSLQKQESRHCFRPQDSIRNNLPRH